MGALGRHELQGDRGGSTGRYGGIAQLHACRCACAPATLERSRVHSRIHSRMCSPVLAGCFSLQHRASEEGMHAERQQSAFVQQTWQILADRLPTLSEDASWLIVPTLVCNAAVVRVLVVHMLSCSIC